MNGKKIAITIAACVCAAVTLVAALRLANQTAQPEEAAPSLIPVETVLPQTGDLANQMDFVGSLSTGESVAVVPKLTAKVKEVRVKAGDEVKAGDVLYIMDTSDYASQVDLAKLALTSAQLSYELTTDVTLETQEDQARLQYRQARDAYEEADAAYSELLKNKTEKVAAMNQGIAAAKTALDGLLASEWGGAGAAQAMAAAQAALQDAETVWVANGASTDPSDPAYIAKNTAAQQLGKLEAAVAAYEGAVGTLSSYEAAVAQTGAGVDAAKTGYRAARMAYDAVSGENRETQEELAGMQLEQAQINYNSLMKQMNDATVTAPVDGKVLSVGVQQNNYASTSSVVMLGSDQSMKITFGLPTNYFGQVQVGDAATVQSSTGTASATVTEVAPMVNPQTGTFTVTAEFAGAEGFLAGATAKVTLTTQHAENVLTIPVDCVRFEDNKPYVYLEQNGFAKKAFLTIGMTDEEVYEVTSGLKSTDRVISTWHPNLADGAAVAAQ